ncbi:single-stranded DNA-binding protein [Nocardioides anomalus]|uniref:Single-stranded DNA-binding protein n=1 Tax=Nocardioides anomalus TaxID=2712223 RepID=A0A6G6WDL3_9ACTN|nr:single-stranded DNA-binding protein [Nocardioides anomalus]QIG43418.1 single-stranded DNA-binding protein [Nocardioides anomalus]
MTAQKVERSEVAADKGAAVNEVRLVGVLGREPATRELPSGDRLMTVQVNVQRPPLPAGQEQPKQRVDPIDCAVWTARLQRSVEKWHEGDLVEVSGAVRRRFFQAGGTLASRVEVEVDRVRLIRRARSG